MDKVLIIDGDSEFLKKLEADLKKYSAQFDIITSSEEDAVTIIHNTRISVFVLGCNLAMENMENLRELVLQRSSRTPCIQLHEPFLEESFPYGESIFRFIEKPLDPDEVAEAVIEGLDYLDEGRFWR